MSQSLTLFKLDQSVLSSSWLPHVLPPMQSCLYFAGCLECTPIYADNLGSCHLPVYADYMSISPIYLCRPHRFQAKHYLGTQIIGSWQMANIIADTIR